MIVKGIISAIYQDQKKISVILPEYDNMTTQPLPIYGTPNMKDYKVNEFVVVFVFNRDFTDAVIMSASSSSLELGETETTAYRGDRGKVAYEHSQAKHAPSDAQKNVQADWNETDAKSDAYLKNKPSTFPPSNHNHSWDSVENKPDTFPPSGHKHKWGEVEEKPSEFPPSNHNHSWESIEGKPNSFTPSEHKHSWESVEGKPSEFPPSSHSHSWESIEGKPNAFPPSEHIHSNKLLWSGAEPMDADAVINLAEAVSKQNLGIVLVFSYRTGDEINNYNFHTFFISKYEVLIHSGVGHNFPMFTVTFGTVSNKYLYIADEYIKGNANNEASGTSGGITYDNSRFVLRYVIGV